MPNTREKLIELLKDTRANAAWHHWGYEESADHLIANGVVPVVRCKDCIYNETGGCEHSESADVGYSPNYFCADGEKKDDGE
jgi:hypothetical protein